MSSIDELYNCPKIYSLSFIKPMKASLTKDYFSDSQWCYERKLDGVRVLVVKKEKEVVLWSRNQKKLNDTYPELEQAFKEADAKNFIVDGEIVTFKNGVSSFKKLQDRMQIKNREDARNSPVKVQLYLFDILVKEKRDLRKRSLQERKRQLKTLISFSDISEIKFLNHVKKDGLDYYKDACKKGWEGVIAKDLQSHYLSSRSKKWLKFKCSQRQEFIITGYTEPEGERVGFGAILIGIYHEEYLKYAGKVGTGFDDKLLEELYDKFKKLEVEDSPVHKQVDEEGVHWIEPKIVCEIGFTEWTDDLKLRHPRFLGIRDDKIPDDVVKEDPE